MNGIFDSHAHYDDAAFDADRCELLKNLPENGVETVINCGTTPASSKESLALAAAYSYIYAAVGLHPEEVGDAVDESALSLIEALAHEKKCVAIGEIGLDYHFRSDNKKQQITVFAWQLEMANRLHLPVIIHDREAHEDTLRLLKEYRPKGVLHCFSGSAESAKEVLSLGLYIGLGGAVTFKNARKPLEVAKMLPADRLLLETDCPYMAPEPFRGKRNDSRLIPYAAEKIAEVRGETADAVLRSAAENAKILFGIG